jgi:hypothetical protein
VDALLLPVAIVVVLAWVLLSRTWAKSPSASSKPDERSAPPVATARLLNRGEQFEYSDGQHKFTGECVWAWREIPGDTPQRAYPITLIPESISRVGVGAAVPLSQRARIEIALSAKRAFELGGTPTIVWNEGDQIEKAV